MALRLVEMVVSEDAAGHAEEWLEPVSVLGMWREPTDDDQVVVRVLVRSDGAEPVVDALQKGLGAYEDFRVMLFEVEATLPKPEEDEGDGKAEDGQVAEKQRDGASGRVAVAELVEKLSDNSRLNHAYIATVIVSTVVAAIGLIRDDVAVIIGSMVIAPLLGPNMALSLATTLGDLKMARRAVWVNGVGVVTSAGIALLFGLLWPFDPTVDQIARRGTVSYSDIVVALAAGSAGALAFTTGLPTAVVGVMVAVALLPPLVASAMLLGAGEFTMAGNAAILLAVNIVCVNVAGVVTFLGQGVQPNDYWEKKSAKKMLKRAAVGWLFVLALLIVLIWVAKVYLVTE